MRKWSITKHNFFVRRVFLCIVPIEPSDINRTLVVGTVMGEVGVVTWEGYDTYPRDGSVEGMY